MGCFSSSKFFLIDQDQEKPAWKEEMKTSKHRLAAFMVKWDSAYSCYGFADVEKDGPIKNVYRLVKLHEVSAVKGKRAK